MNQGIHRVVFNAARGLRMVVHEGARIVGKATGATPGLVMAAFLLLAPAQAQIAGDRSAPGNLRPTVLVAPNGVPLINIQTPSAAGVSRNHFSQFDVPANGAILNNSRTAVQTQLGGWVQGNPWLGNGSARVILNEITSGNPTRLRGFIEVGGQKAEVVIANPAGIAVDGGGFINASRATLTTGTPQLNAMGGLDSYVVRGGTVSIDGAGLDARSTDYAGILARAVQVNAGIWANELKVVTGANQVSADHGQITPTAGTGPTPAFALDVAHLGGMYEGKIMLIGTEAGLGARNAGSIAGGVGELVVTAAGRLENRGTLEAQRLQLASAGDIDNRGGTIRQTGAAALTFTAPALSNTAGGVIGAEPPSQAPSQPGSPGTTDPSPAPSPSTPSASTPSAARDTAPSQPPAPGAITAAGAILNDGGRIYAGGPIAIQAPRVNNNGGTLATANLSVSGPAFSNAGGTLNIANAFTAQVDRFDNTAGTLHAGSLNIAAAGDLINQDGTLVADGDATLTAGGQLNNTRGTLAAGGNATLQGTSVDLSASQVSGANLAITATQGHVITSKATVVTPGTLGITANARPDQSLINDGGTLSAARLDLKASNLNNVGGEIVHSGPEAMRIAVAGTLNNTQGRIAGNAQDLKALSMKVNEGRLSWDEEVSAVMANLCGAFLGKAILCTYSDRSVRWVQANNDLGILFPAPSGGPIKIAFPVARVLEQIEHGEQYSIHGFFKMLPEFMGPL